MRYFDRDYFHLLREIVVAQFKLRDQSTALGLVWSLLHPLLLFGAIFIFFHEPIGMHIPHYSIYLLIGLIHYTHFANSTSVGMTSLQSMKRLTNDTVFPKEILTVSSTVVGSIEFF